MTCFLRGVAGDEDKQPQSTVWLQYVFVFTIVWSLGSTLTQDSREKFNEFYRSLLNGHIKENPKPKDFKVTDSAFTYLKSRSCNKLIENPICS